MIKSKLYQGRSPYDWQNKILDYEGNIHLRTGRQVGKSVTLGIKGAEWAINHKNKVVVVIALTERQAYLIYEKILFHLMDNHKNDIKAGKDRPTKSLIQLKNGTKIYCLPTGMTGFGIRGFSIDLLIADEAHFIPDEVFNSILPALAARKALIWLSSTPFGREGYFYECENDDSFLHIHVSTEEVPHIDKAFLEREKARMTKRQYSQEYLGEYVDGLMQWFPDDLIKKCMRVVRPNKIDKSLNYYLGSDLARMGEDETSLEIVNKINNKRVVQVENLVTKHTYLTENAKTIKQLDVQYDFQRILIDDEGSCVGTFDILMDDDQTKRKTIGINNSKRIISKDGRETRLLKEDLYSNLLRMMERGEIDLLDDPNIFASLKSVQFDYTTDTQGKPHLKIFGNYTHIAEGLIRAAWCVKYKDLNFWITSI